MPTKKYYCDITKGPVTRDNFSCNLCHNKRCVATCKKDFTYKTPFLQPAMQQNVALRVARKVELSSTFRNGARQVAACGMSIVTCNAILLKLANQRVFYSQEISLKLAAEERVVSNFQRARCQLRKNIANVSHPLCNLHCFSVVIVTFQDARRLALCNMV